MGMLVKAADKKEKPVMDYIEVRHGLDCFKMCMFRLYLLAGLHVIDQSPNQDAEDNAEACTHPTGRPKDDVTDNPAY